MTVDEMLSKMSIKELNYWKAFSLLEPFGPREELRRTLLIVCSILNSIPRDPKKGKKIFKVDDYLPDLADLEEKMFANEEQKMANARNALFKFANDVKIANERKKKKKVKTKIKRNR